MPDFDPAAIDKIVLSNGLRNESAMAVAARTVSHSQAARRLGVAKQTLGYWIEKHDKEASLIYAARGLKLVPIDDNNYSAEDIAALQHLAGKGLRSLAPLRMNFTVVDHVDDGDESR